jgi:hypothetical protein
VSQSAMASTPPLSAAPVPAIIRPAALLADIVSAAVAYQGQAGSPYRYETATPTRTESPTSTSTITKGPETAEPAPVWPFIAGGVGAIVIGCVLMVADRTLRGAGAPKEPML